MPFDFTFLFHLKRVKKIEKEGGRRKWNKKIMKKRKANKN